ncbi:hypothetical protein [Anaerosporobacter faecicola]|uniref:hypothetical protein n=1 Tax=Anaerosporobacter faecicola TaxID=2718714 RepID=UPI001439B985|nr:hypothetical protein [Anaerosporobacter faecicola]
MSRSEVSNNLINASFKKAVLRREDIKRTYIVLDSLLYNYDMEQYINIAKQRILDMEGVEYLLEHDHIEYNILEGLMELDEVAVLCCKDIIKGYVKESTYQSCLELIRAKDEYVRLCNDTIKYYRDKSTIESVRDYFKHMIMKPIDKEQGELIKVILECYKLELSSRFPLVKLYYRLYNWLCKKAASLMVHKLKREVGIHA